MIILHHISNDDISYSPSFGIQITYPNYVYVISFISFGFRFRCRKYWLKGERKGKLETFAENLPGAPDNINLAPDGTFWIAIIKVLKFYSCIKNIV